MGRDCTMTPHHNAEGHCEGYLWNYGVLVVAIALLLLLLLLLTGSSCGIGYAAHGHASSDASGVPVLFPRVLNGIPMLQLPGHGAKC